jgi:hypothetical protein
METNNLFLGMLVNGLVCLGGLVVVYRKLCGAAEKRQIEPQPLVVRKDLEPISREDCVRQHQAEERFMAARFTAIENRLTELTASLERRNEAGEERASGIHKRVDAVAADLAETKGILAEHIAHGGHDDG